jgi:hypothetical protein
LKLAVDLLPKEATLDVDISITKAIDAVSAFRLLQSLPRHKLEQLRHDAAREDAEEKGPAALPTILNRR